MAPGSTAYSHLCQTNVSSYAIVGSWEPDAFFSHAAEEGLFKNILVNLFYDLDRNGFQGNFTGDNDLQVNLTSQAGGLDSGGFRLPGNAAIPNEIVIYPNTVHSSKLIIPLDQNISSELH